MYVHRLQSFCSSSSEIMHEAMGFVGRICCERRDHDICKMYNIMNSFSCILTASMRICTNLATIWDYTFVSSMIHHEWQCY